MSTENKSKEIDNIHKKTFECIGQFVVVFENMVENMRYLLSRILKDNGLKENDLFDILVSDTTAGPLLNHLNAFIKSQYSEELSDKNNSDFMSKLSKDIIKAITLRNDIVHAHWYFAIESVSDTEYAYTLNATRNRLRAHQIENVHEDMSESKLEEIKGDIIKINKISEALVILSFNLGTKKKFDEPITFGIH